MCILLSAWLSMAKVNVFGNFFSLRWLLQGRSINFFFFLQKCMLILAFEAKSALSCKIALFLCGFFRFQKDIFKVTQKVFLGDFGRTKR